MKIILLLLVNLLLIGCSSTGTKKLDSSNDQVYSLPLKSYVSTRNDLTIKSQNCPNNNGWKKESTEKLIFYANSCAVAGSAARLELLGDWLAQKQPYSPWGAYFLSVSAHLNKHYRRAAWMIELAIKKSSKTALLHYQKGRIFWDAGDFVNAITAFNKSIELNSSFADAQLFLAQLYFKDQNFKQAEYHFSKVTKIEPSNSIAFAGLAESQYLLGSTSTAVDNYIVAVNLNPRNISYRIKLAEIYENHKKDYESALTTYKRLYSFMKSSNISLKQVPFDLDAKIKKLESLVHKRDIAGKKISHSDDTVIKKR